MPHAYFSPATFRFLRALARHNNRTWFKAHQNDFSTPEQVALEYLEVDGSQVKLDTPVDDAAVKERYEKDFKAQADFNLSKGLLKTVPALADVARPEIMQAVAPERATGW